MRHKAQGTGRKGRQNISDLEFEILNFYFSSALDLVFVFFSCALHLAPFLQVMPAVGKVKALIAQREI